MSHESIPYDKLTRFKALLYAFIVVTLLALCAALTGIAYLAYQASEQSMKNGQVLESVKKTNTQLISCTTPEGECYKDGARRTGEAVVGINEVTLKVIVAALSCQEDGLTDERELAKCTSRRTASG